MKNNFSKNILYLVKRKKLTQDDFGLLFDLKKGVINQYILDKSFPKIDTLNKIAYHFKISLDELVNDDLENSYKLDSIKASDFIKATPELEALATELLEYKNKEIAELKEKLEGCLQEKKELYTTMKVTDTAEFEKIVAEKKPRTIVK